MKVLALGSLLTFFSVGATAAKVASDLTDLERDARALELYLQDRDDYNKYCPFRTWEQPPLSVYKKDLTSHLPEGCKPNNQ